MKKRVILTKDKGAFYVEGDGEVEISFGDEQPIETIDVSFANEKDWEGIKKNPWDKKRLLKFSIPTSSSKS